MSHDILIICKCYIHVCRCIEENSQRERVQELQLISREQGLPYILKACANSSPIKPRFM